MRTRRICHLAALFVCVACVARGGDAWTHVTKENKTGLPGDEIQFLEPDGKGVWIGTLGGVARWEGEKIVPLAGTQKLHAWDILRWKGALLVGHGNGVVIIRDGKTTGALGGNTVAPIVPLGDKEVWALAKNRGSETNTLFRYDGEKWTPVEAFAKARPEDLFLASDGAVWVVDEGNGLYRVAPDAEEFDLEHLPHHLEGLSVTAVFEDSAGRMWCGLWGRGMRSFDGESWTPHRPDDESAVLVVSEDTKGNIWAGTTASGAWRYDGKTWTTLLADEGGIGVLQPTSDGRVWVASQEGGGLRYWNGEEWVMSLQTPLPIRCVAEAEDGTVIAGGVLDGLHILQKK